MKFFSDTIFRKVLSVASIVWVLAFFSGTRLYNNTRNMDDFILAIIALIVVWGIVWIIESLPKKAPIDVEEVKKKVDLSWAKWLLAYTVAIIIVHLMIPNQEQRIINDVYISYVIGKQSVIFLIVMAIFHNFHGRGKGWKINLFSAVCIYTALVIGALL